MSRNWLLLCLCVALCGCGDTSKAPATAGNSSTGSTAGTGAATSDPFATASSTTGTADKDAADPKEDMADTGDGNGGKKVAEGDASEKDADQEDKKPGKITVEQVFQAANRFMQRGDSKRALAELEKALPDNPEDKQLLVVLASLTARTAKAGDYDAYKNAASYLRRAIKADPNLVEQPGFDGFAGGVYYNEACALAKEDKPAEALKILDDAFQAGFKNVAALDKDEDLTSVRELPEFAEFLERTREVVRQRNKKELEKIFAETKPFDFTFELTDIEGKAIAMADLKGKVAIIDVWGTWCPPCRQEIPHFVELQSKYKDAGLEIVGLNSEGEENDEAVKKVQEFHKENNMNYRCALVTQEFLKQQIPEFRAFPTTMFFDRSGKVRAKLVGATDLETLEMIAAALLEEKFDGGTDGDQEKSDKETKSGGAGN